MKKRIFIIVALALPMLAWGQERVTSEVLGMKVLKFEREGQMAVVELGMDLNGARLHTTDRWEVTPVIQAGAQMVDLPKIVVNGHNKSNMVKRAQRLRYAPIMYGATDALVDETLRHREQREVMYRTELPWETWMSAASLGLNTRLISCSHEYELHERLAGVSMPVLPPVAVVPRASYMAPVREKVKERMVSKTAYVDFRVNQSTIDRNFERNPEELTKIKKELDNIKNHKDMTFQSIALTGYASPEGPYANNDRLAGHRVNALKSYVVGNFGIPAASVAVHHTAEDWEGLRKEVAASKLADKDAVLAIIDNSQTPDAKEAALKALNGGRAWATILHEMMPPLRRTDYKLNYTVRDYNEQESREIVKTNPELLSLYELDALARQYDPKSAEYQRIYNLIEVQNPNDDTANINVAANYINHGDWRGAEQALSRVSNRDASYWNNFGIVQMMTGHFDAAADAFRRSTTADAQHNLRLLEGMRQ